MATSAVSDAAASTSSPADAKQFFCYGCNVRMTPTSGGGADPTCSACGSEFIEEVEDSTPASAPPLPASASQLPPPPAPQPQQMPFMTNAFPFGNMFGPFLSQYARGPLCVCVWVSSVVGLTWLRLRESRDVAIDPHL